MAYSAFPIPYGEAGGDGKRIKNTWTVFGHTYVPGNVVRYANGGIELAQANNQTNVQAIGVVESITANTVTVVYQGEIDFGAQSITSAIVGGSATLVPGSVYYISQTSAGKLDINRPSSGYVQGILVATGAKAGIVINSLQQSSNEGPSVGVVNVNTVGMIVPWAGDATSTIPTNWKLCDGEAVRKSGLDPVDGNDYSTLYGVIGDKYHIRAIVDSIEDGDVPSQDMIVSFVEGHDENSTEPCHGLVNAFLQDTNLDYRVGWGGTNDFAVATIIDATGSSDTVRFRFKQSYPGVSPRADFPPLAQATAITIKSLDDNEVSGFTSDRFFIPDLRARTIFGAGYSTGLASISRGDMAGDSVHLLSMGEVPSHDNTLNVSDSPSSGSNDVTVVNAGLTASSVYESIDASFTSDNDPISLMPPYLATNWIIRYGSSESVAIGPTGATGLPGINGSNGAAGATGFGYTAAHVSGDGDLYMSILFPDGTSGAPYSIGTVGGGGGTEGPKGETGATGSTGFGYTAANVVGGELFISVLNPDGSVGDPFSIGSVVGSGSVGSTGSTGATGFTGATGSTGFGFTAAHVSGDGDLYMSILFPDGTSGPEFSIGSVVGVAEVGGQNGQVLFNKQGEATGSNAFLFDGTSVTFGGANTKFTVTGPTFSFGDKTRIVDGVFVNPKEDSYYIDNGSGNIIISGLNGSIQRFTISPSGTFTVGASSSSGHWSNETDVVETVNVIIQTQNGQTGTFANDIICPSPRPVFCGVAGGIDILSIMRIKTAGGSVTMGFVIARAMTGPGVSIAN